MSYESRQPVRFSDIDRAGIVYYPRFFDYWHRAFEDFFAAATLNPDVHLITRVICGKRVEEIEDPLMRQIRYLDKLVDELARGKAMEKVLRAG